MILPDQKFMQQLPRTVVDPHLHPRMELLDDWSPEAMAEDLLRHMDRSGITVAGILGRVLPPFGDANFIRDGNDYTIAMVRACPERLYGLCYVNSGLDVSFVQEELDRCLRLPEMRGIKQEIDVNARDPRLDPVMEMAEAFDVPVLFHAWTLNTWNMNAAQKAEQAQHSDPADIVHLARRFPRVRILMPHLEGVGPRGVDTIAGQPNIWIDTSGSQPFTGTLEYALQRLGKTRILFGSDWPVRGFQSQLGRILGAGLPADTLASILFRNASSLFRLDNQSAEKQPFSLLK